MRARRRLNGSATLALLSLAVATASSCSGESKRSARDADAGEAGAADSGAGAGQGGSAGTAGEGPDVGGDAGKSDGGSTAGADSSAGAGNSAGEGGGASGETLAPFGMLFSVAPGAEGVPGTGVASEAPEAASNLYASSGSGATHVKGTNSVGYTAAELGLDAADDLDAVSAIHPAAVSAFYFSVRDIGTHAEGIDATGVRRASTEGEVQSDIFMSYGLAPLNGDGSNIEWVDEYRLGLTPETAGSGSSDNLNALDIDVPAGTKPIFFSVGPGALGAVGSAVATVTPGELACTIFSSNLDGTNEVAFSCSELGLAAGDDVDALVVLGAGAAAQTLLFSVTSNSVGLGGTAVAQQAGQAAADVFASDGTGTNTVYVEERALGLLPEDDLDALAIEPDTSPLGTWVSPPPEEPPPAVPPACGWDLPRERTNPGATKPVPNSARAKGSRVATQTGRITKSSSRVRTLSASDVARVNALQRCGTRAPRAATAAAPAAPFEVLCPAGAPDLAPGNYLIGAIETEEQLDFDAWAQIQIALILDTDGDPTNNYFAAPPYDFDTFDNTDQALQLQKSGSALLVRAQDISVNPFQNLVGVPNRIIIQGRRYTFVVRVEAPRAYPHRFTLYLAGQNPDDWSMSNVNLVGEAMQIADLSSCD